MANITQTGTQYSLASIGGIWYWTVEANNITGAGQFFQISNILTPYGKLTDVNVPIPGDVVQAMATGITNLSQQLNSVFSIISPNPLQFNVTVTEGDPPIQIGVIQFINAGAMGSFMSVSASSSAPWLTVAPAAVAGVGQGQSGQFTVSINPSVLLSSVSPYSVSITLSVANTSITIAIPVIVNVLPRPAIMIAPTSINFVYSLSGGSIPSNVIQTISNVGPATSILNVNLGKLLNCSPWLSFAPTSIGPLAAGGSAMVAYSIVGFGIPQIVGTFNETVRIISQNASNSPVDVPVILTVTP